MKRNHVFPALCAAFLMLLLFTLPAGAEEASHAGTVIMSSDGSPVPALTDGSNATYLTLPENASLTVSLEGGMEGLYIIFDRVPEPWILTDNRNGTVLSLGENGFLHEYADVASLLGSASDALTLTFPMGAVIADIYAFSAGELPDWVQRWEPPCTEADLLLFSSHSDDEQLFFAGLLPLYAGEKGYEVQVAYMVQHFEANGYQDHTRPHEQLNGLWAVGVTHYPVMSDFPDLYSESLDGARSVYAPVGVTEEDFIAYLTENIRRFRPLVVVSHDPKGEYGHGTHILTTHALTEALKITEDSAVFPDSAERWGTWIPEKVYLHLYPENPLTLDIDTPLEAFGGKTAFQMTQYGFSFHKSQHWTWFNDWIYGKNGNTITRSDQIWGYSPREYGLYHTTVGLDAAGGDMFENVKTYTIRHAEEEAARGETAAPETTPAPETGSASPIPTETNVATEQPETESSAPPPASEDFSTSKLLSFAFVGLLCAAVAAVFVVYAVVASKLKRKRRRK